MTDKFELVVDERKEVEDAMAVFEKYKICVGTYLGIRKYHVGKNCTPAKSKEYILDNMFPPALSKEQIKLNELKEQIVALQQTANELEETINAE